VTEQVMLKYIRETVVMSSLPPLVGVGGNKLLFCGTILYLPYLFLLVSK